ncbi:MAG TPA: (2Fe-2S)-binding protein [Fimbriimonadaceae bacterium]|nr:(2Fe-2S)-binding protein [Fimbriimonadaceae bacterium]
MDITLDVNGVKRRVDAPPETSLLEVLRDDLGLTGTKYGCGESQCGACTVLVDGESVHSCVTQLSEVAGKPILTIEGITKDGKLHPLQQAFLDEGAMQCGYCVTGMIMAAYSLLKAKPHPSEAEIAEHMNGNVCRCGGYPRMVAAIKRASGMIDDRLNAPTA